MGIHPAATRTTTASGLKLGRPKHGLRKPRQTFAKVGIGRTR